MNYLEYILLGVVQGLTEFFPISSSGHLLLLRKLFGINEGGLLIEVALHLGTLLSILFFWKKFIGEKIQETFKGNLNYLSIIVVGNIGLLPSISHSQAAAIDPIIPAIAKDLVFK